MGADEIAMLMNEMHKIRGDISFVEMRQIVDLFQSAGFVKQKVVIANSATTKEKQIEQIEEMRAILCRSGAINHCEYCEDCEGIVEALYNAGYRKQSENIVELPCKVGDWIWYVYRNEINKAKVEEIQYDASKHGYYSYSFVVYAYDFKNKRQVSYYPINETQKNKANINEVEGMEFDEDVYIFLTKAEAKAKMKGGE